MTFWIVVFLLVAVVMLAVELIGRMSRKRRARNGGAGGMQSDASSGDGDPGVGEGD